MEWELATYTPPNRRQLEIENVSCINHPSNTAWWWKSTCSHCRDTYNDILSHATSSRSRSLSAFCEHNDLSASTESAPSNESPESIDYHNNRNRRHQRANAKYPSTFPRMGSDTNLFAFTGKILAIKREGLTALGRTIEGSKITNSSGFSWK